MVLKIFRMTSLELEIECPDFVFPTTDPWGLAFREALATVDFRGKRVFEAGCGSGAVALQVLQNQIQALYLNDLIPEVLEVSRRNVARHAPAQDIRLLLGDAPEILGAWKDDPVDYVIGCLPQVPAHGDDIFAGRTAADEYDETKHPKLEQWGLCLLYDLKVSAKKVLGHGGSMILVHSGRVPSSARRLLDEEAGYTETRIILERMVRHDPGTPLEYLYGHSEVLLFRDAEGREPISPEEAEQIRRQYLDGHLQEDEYTVFHSVLVIESRPK